MHYPSINRWGANLFWVNSWFTDKLQPLYVQQDLLLNKLIYYFFIFGLFNKKNFLFSTYWINLNSIAQLDFFANYLLNTFRIKAVNQKSKADEFQINSRVQPTNIYTSKVWVLRYQFWILILFYSLNFFKYFEKKKKKTLFFKEHLVLSLVKKKKKLKFFFLFCYLLLQSKKLFYLF